MPYIDDEFYFYGQLLRLESIAAQYAAGGDLCEKIKQTAEQISSRRYRVAVIGEFKRGKSSLVNALLGASVLPTDILPATGTVNRIVYGTQKSIRIMFKDGSTHDGAIDELLDYGTKLDKQKAEVSGSVSEIIVTYPSEFCKNHIELFDTPGLNDNDSMTASTLGVLHDIDAAVVVVSAKLPLSMTERELIIKLIEHKGIHHIIFVITFIDAVSARRSEQDKMTAYITERIASQTMELAREKHGDDADFLAKAKSVLDEPTVFAVSSTLAMEGFINNDRELLEQSRFPSFKEKLFTLLSAQQTMSIQAKTMQLLDEAALSIGKWYEHALTASESSKAELAQCKVYINQLMPSLQKCFIQADDTFANRGMSSVRGTFLTEFYDSCLKCYIKQLSALRAAGTTSDDVAGALNAAADECDVMASYFIAGFERECREVMRCAESRYSRSEVEILAQYGRKAEFYERADAAVTFPAWAVDRCFYHSCANLIECDVISDVRSMLFRCSEKLMNDWDEFAAAWRKNMFDRAACYKSELEKAALGIEQRLGENTEQFIALSINHERNIQQIDKMAGEIHAMRRSCECRQQFL